MEYWKVYKTHLKPNMKRRTDFIVRDWFASGVQVFVNEGQLNSSEEDGRAHRLSYTLWSAMPWSENQGGGLCQSKLKSATKRLSTRPSYIKVSTTLKKEKPQQESINDRVVNVIPRPSNKPITST